jgi:hypothetical protein
MLDCFYEIFFIMIELYDLIELMMKINSLIKIIKLYIHIVFIIVISFIFAGLFDVMFNLIKSNAL